MIDLKEIYYVPISTITKIKDDGVKSFNPKNCSYPFYIVPGEWKRKFKKCDYNFMLTLQEGE